MAGHFEAKKIAWRQTKDGLVLALAVHPDDMPKEMALSALNTRYMIAFSEIGDDERPVSPAQAEQSEAVPPKKPWSEYSRSQQAAILNSDPLFQQYFKAADHVACNEKLKQHFRITSKRELDNPFYHEKWDEFVALYKLHEQRYAGSKR